MIKKIINKTISGIGLGSFLAVVFILIMDFQDIQITNLAVNVFLIITIAVGFFLAELVFEMELLSTISKLILQTFIGIVIGIVLSFSLGFDANSTVLISMISICIFVIVWTISFIADRIEVNKVNKVIEKHNRNEDN